MITRVLRLGTRRSALAMAQAAGIARQIETAAKESGQDLVVELVGLSSAGDETSAPLASLGGTGVFVSRLRQALVDGEVDAAVHSLKDLPTAPMPGIALAAVPLREDPRDVLICRRGVSLVTASPSCTPSSPMLIGTGSPRRAAQLAALAIDRGLQLEMRDLRGNVDSRIRRVATGSDLTDLNAPDRNATDRNATNSNVADLDAVVLAYAGLRRLGREDEISEILPTDVMLPAPGQGALGLECRDDDEATLTALRRVEDADTRACVVAERTVLAAVEAGCAAPLGALAEITTHETSGGVPTRRLRLRAVVARPDGTLVLRRESTLDQPSLERATEAALSLAAQLLADGAGSLISGSAGVDSPAPPSADHVGASR